MTKTYLVSGRINYEGGCCYGVFSTKEKAINRIKQITAYSEDELYIYEIDVDSDFCELETHSSLIFDGKTGEPLYDTKESE